MYNLKPRPADRVYGPPTAEERRQSMKLWIRNTQQTMYKNVYESLQRKSPPYPPIVRQLRLFMDSDELLRSEGRIHNAPLMPDTKFAYVLPQHHRFTELFVKDCHARIRHAGINTTVTFIRQHVWIPSIGQYVKTLEAMHQL